MRPFALLMLLSFEVAIHWSVLNNVYETSAHSVAVCHSENRGAKMKNDEGEVVDLYIPRKWCV